MSVPQEGWSFSCFLLSSFVLHSECRECLNAVLGRLWDRFQSSGGDVLAGELTCLLRAGLHPSLLSSPRPAHPASSGGSEHTLKHPLLGPTPLPAGAPLPGSSGGKRGFLPEFSLARGGADLRLGLVLWAGPQGKPRNSKQVISPFCTLRVSCVLSPGGCCLALSHNQ